MVARSCPSHLLVAAAARKPVAVGHETDFHAFGVELPSQVGLYRVNGCTPIIKLGTW